jgi:WG containing repeat
MKKSFFTLAFVVVSTLCFAQNGYEKVSKYDEYNKDWALVKTISGTYGFINRNGETVVQPIYDKIEKFTENSGKYALVKSVAGSYGFIDRNGKEVVPTIYWNKREALEQLKTLKE